LLQHPFNIDYYHTASQKFSLRLISQPIIDYFYYKKKSFNCSYRNWNSHDMYPILHKSFAPHQFDLVGIVKFGDASPNHIIKNFQIHCM